MFRSGNRSRESPPRRAATGDVDPKPVGRCSVTVDRVRGEGNDQLKRRTNTMKMPLDSVSGRGFQIEETSFSSEFSQRLPKKAAGTPIKVLLDEEMSKESEFRRSSPNVVARLMGLDNMPPKRHHKPHDGKKLCSLKESFIRCQDKNASCEDHSFQMCKDECQDFRDVFEIVEASASKKHKELQKGSSRPKRSDTYMAFTRKKFMKANHLLANETLQQSKEFDDALEALDSKRDLFLEFLQDPNSLFSKHLQDLKHVSCPPHAKHITILKSSRSTMQCNDRVYHRSKRNGGSCACASEEGIACSRKPSPVVINHSLKEESSPLAHSMLESDYMVMGDAYRHPTQIVVLKPSIDKAQRTARSVVLPRYPDDYQFGNKGYRETQKASILELFLEGSTPRKSVDSVENMDHRTKGSRQIAREITEKMRNKINDGWGKVASSRLNQIKKAQSTCTISEVDDAEAFQWTSNHFNSLYDSSSFSSPCSTETSVSREARKRISERWKMAKRSKEAGLLDKASGTLREILALSDREVHSAPLNSFITQKDETLATDEVITRSSYVISSNDSWKERCSGNFQRSNSLPASSDYRNSKPSAKCKAGGDSKCYMLKDVLNLNSDDSLVEIINLREHSSHRSFKQQRRKHPQYDSNDEQNILPEREIHVNMERSINNSYVNHRSKDMLCENSDGSVSHKLSSFISTNELIMEPIPCTLLEKDLDISGYHQNDFTTQETFDCQMGTLSPHGHITELGSPSSSKEAEQPSPMSVLESPFEEDTSSTGCFERVSADLKELRMQLQLLKSESLGRSAEEPELILSDDDAGGCCPIPTEFGEILDEAGRDFSYMVDVLNLGFNGADWAGLSDACFSAECPVWPSVFDNLEKKYSNLESWSKSERKQLFDLINSVLAEIIAPRKILHPWVKQWRLYHPAPASGELAEKVWQMVVSNQKEISGKLEQFLETKWLDIVADVDLISIELETMLKEDLMEELVSEFMLTPSRSSTSKCFYGLR